MISAGHTAIEIYEASDAWAQTEPEIAELVGEAARAALGDRNGEMTIQLTDDAEMCGLNLRHRGKNHPTNVLSFPAPAGFGGRLGDIALGFETVAAEAVAQGKSLGNHTRHLVVHGVLHLLGYDHENEREADIMEGLERSILARLGVADPYLERD